MSTIIRNNIHAIRTYNTMSVNHSHAQKSLTRIATGEKVNSAQDDSAAYSISERMRNRIRSLEQAHRNTQNGSSMLRTAEGAVAEILELVRTLKEKAVNAANDSNTAEDRQTLQKEFNQLVDQIDDSALVTFNGKYLVDGTKNNAFVFSRSLLHNGKLAIGTVGDTVFSTLKSRTGESLGINEDDKIYGSFVSNGEMFHLEATGKDTLNKFRDDLWSTTIHKLVSWNNGTGLRSTLSFPNKFGQKIYADSGHALEPNEVKLKEQIFGYVINVVDSQGNINKFANRMLQYDEVNRPESQTGDLALSFQVGTEANVATKFALTDMRALALGLKGDKQTLSISTQRDANVAIAVLDNAVNKVLDQQTTIGAALSRMEFTATNLTTSTQNVQAAESTVRDADMAREITNFTRDRLLAQSSQAMLAQANQNSSDVLGLLQ